MVIAGLGVRAGSDVTLVTRRETLAHTLRTTRHHPYSVPGYRLPDAVSISQDAEGVLREEPDVLVSAVPSKAVSAVAEVVARSEFLGPIVSATKGIDPDSLTTATKRFARQLGGEDRLAVLSGPNLAGEIAEGHPAAAVVASTNEAVAHLARSALMCPSFRVYTARDVIGVEIAGAVKNTIAIGAGIADGLGAGENARAAYITRGVAEMARLGIVLGANPLTFAGLAGIGDLIATCSSERSRNHTVGRGLAAGKSLDTVLAGMREVAEGVPTTRAALKLGQAHGVELPIVQQIARVMFDGVNPVEAIDALMARDATDELNFLS